MKREIALILLAPLFILLAVVKPMAGTLPTPTVTDLYNFTDGNDAYYPYSGLLVGADGNLYGTTIRGGTGEYGTVFELSHSNGGWTETVLYNFTANGDGGEPMATLVADAAGNLYGTTLTGGTITNVCHTGCGVVFELIRGSSGWTENTLYSFAGRPDGEYPESSVAFDSAGDIFGTTTGGGTDESYGIVFELMPSGGNWTEKILHTFTAGNDGAFPAAGVILDKKGDLYGTTVGSGTGQGTVYEMVRSGAGTWSRESSTHLQEAMTGAALGTSWSGMPPAIFMGRHIKEAVLRRFAPSGAAPSLSFHLPAEAGPRIYFTSFLRALMDWPQPQE